MEIGAEATQFPEKEYINGIAVAVAQEGICTIVGLNGILRICRKNEEYAERNLFFEQKLVT
jgi:hypothetical protein